MKLLIIKIDRIIINRVEIVPHALLLMELMLLRLRWFKTILDGPELCEIGVCAAVDFLEL